MGDSPFNSSPSQLVSESLSWWLGCGEWAAAEALWVHMQGQSQSDTEATLTNPDGKLGLCGTPGDRQGLPCMADLRFHGYQAGEVMRVSALGSVLGLEFGDMLF